MRNVILLGAAGALLTGVLIGLQSSLSNRTGQLIGPLKTGLLTNVIGGGLALLALLIALAARWVSRDLPPPQALRMLIAAGLLGIFIIAGVAYALRYTGVVAGLSAIILGQMLVSSLVDAAGLFGLPRIAFTWQRGLGLALLALAVYLLLPKK